MATPKTTVHVIPSPIKGEEPVYTLVVSGSKATEHWSVEPTDKLKRHVFSQLVKLVHLLTIENDRLKAGKKDEKAEPAFTGGTVGGALN